MFRTEDSEAFAISAVGRVVEITEHVVAFDLGLENGAEGCLALELVEAPLHVADGVAHGEAVPARDAADGCRFRLAFGQLVRFVVRVVVHREALDFAGYGVDFLLDSPVQHQPMNNIHHKMIRRNAEADSIQ